MRTKYKIRARYEAYKDIEVEVDGEDNSHGELEGLALDKARDIAEDSDIREFTISRELEFQVLRRGD